MNTAQLEARAKRTRTLIDHFNKAFGDKAWTKLHGILCMDHGFSGEDEKLIASVFDGIMIAEELDRQNAEAVKATRSQS